MSTAVAAAPANMTPPAAAQDGGDNGGAAAAPVELSARQKSRLEGLPAEARKVIEERKKAAVKPAAAATPPLDKEAAKAVEKTGDDAGKAADDLPKGAIDFSSDSLPKKADENADVLPEEDVVIEGLNAEGQKRLRELNHKSQTFRKRTQEAEKTAAEAKAASDKAAARLAELESELDKARTAPAQSGNWYAKVTDENVLAQVEANAKAGLRTLQRAALSGGEAPEHTFLDGTKRALTVDDLDDFTTALDHVEQQRESLKKTADSAVKAKSILDRMSGVDGFTELHQKAKSVDWNNDRPTLAAKLAVAELALSGNYLLVPKGGKAAPKDLEKAAAATSAAQQAEGSKAAPIPPKKEPAPEITGTPPRVNKGKDYDGLLSAAKARAANGDQQAVGEMIRLKREKREAEKAG